MSDMLAHERQLRKLGYTRVVGVDEVGRGPYAGPVVAAAVLLPEDADYNYINDSKKLTISQRESANLKIINLCSVVGEIRFAYGAASVKVIDRIGILNASMLAMKRAISKIQPPPDYVLVDGNRLPESLGIDGLAIVKGDSLSRSIAAASILAKVLRDRLMDRLDKRYPQYNFSHNKGYGTAHHCKILKEFGPTPLHRYSFEPVRQVALDFQFDSTRD